MLSLPENISSKTIIRLERYEDWSLDPLYLFDGHENVAVLAFLDSESFERYCGAFVYFGQENDLKEIDNLLEHFAKHNITMDSFPFDVAIEDLSTEGRRLIFRLYNAIKSSLKKEE